MSTPDPSGNNIVLQFQFHAEESSRIALLLVRVQIPDGNRKSAGGVSLDECCVQIKAKHYLQATS